MCRRPIPVPVKLRITKNQEEACLGNRRIHLSDGGNNFMDTQKF